MLTRIGVEFEGAELILPILGITPKDSLLVRQITGLNPPDINLFIGEFSRDGGIYQGRRVGNRNPVITLDLNPNPALGESIASWREALYKAFVDPLVDADYVKLNLYDDLGRVRYLVGYTEKFETEIFAVETMVQISMICPDPYLRDDNETVISNITPTPAAWSDLPLYAVGNRVRYNNTSYQAIVANQNKRPDVNSTYWTVLSTGGWTTVPFAYGGTAETGFNVTIYVTSTTQTVTLENNPWTYDQSRPEYYKGRMIISKAPDTFAVGDIIRINTVRGQRSLTLQGALPEASIVGYLNAASPWLELHSQSNTMKVYGADESQLVASILDLSYIQSYWGV